MNEHEEYPLPQLMVSCGAAYTKERNYCSGRFDPDIRIALMDREEPRTVPVQRDAYLRAIVKACNNHQKMSDALSIALGFIVAVKLAGQTNTMHDFDKLSPPYSVETVIREALKL